MVKKKYFSQSSQRKNHLVFFVRTIVTVMILKILIVKLVFVLRRLNSVFLSVSILVVFLDISNSLLTF